MTSKELHALRNSELSKHPMKVANTTKLMNRLKRTCGDELWQTLTDVLEVAQTTNNPPLWVSTMGELIRKKEQEEELALKKEKEKEELLLQEKKKAELESLKINDNLYRVSSKSSVVRRVVLPFKR